MPRVGDIMILKSDTTLAPVKSFVAQVKVLTHPGELKVGYSPIAFVRTARSAVKMTQIAWKIGKATGGKKQEAPAFVKANEMAELTFEPLQPFVVDTFKSCEVRNFFCSFGLLVFCGRDSSLWLSFFEANCLVAGSGPHCHHGGQQCRHVGKGDQDQPRVNSHFWTSTLWNCIVCGERLH
jgi:hypothetical protein